MRLHGSLRECRRVGCSVRFQSAALSYKGGVNPPRVPCEGCSRRPLIPACKGFEISTKGLGRTSQNRLHGKSLIHTEGGLCPVLSLYGFHRPYTGLRLVGCSSHFRSPNHYHQTGPGDQQGGVAISDGWPDTPTSAPLPETSSMARTSAVGGRPNLEGGQIPENQKNALPVERSSRA